MRANLLILLIASLVGSCSNKEKIPPDLIPQKKMQLILWDMMRADQFLTDFVLNRDTSLDKTGERLKYYNRIFSLHKISRENFQQSFHYYKQQPALFKMLMDSLSTPPLSNVPESPTLEKVQVP